MPTLWKKAKFFSQLWINTNIYPDQSSMPCLKANWSSFLVILCACNWTEKPQHFCVKLAELVNGMLRSPDSWLSHACKKEKHRNSVTAKIVQYEVILYLHEKHRISSVLHEVPFLYHNIQLFKEVAQSVFAMQTGFSSSSSCDHSVTFLQIDINSGSIFLDSRASCKTGTNPTYIHNAQRKISVKFCQLCRKVCFAHN